MQILGPRSLNRSLNRNLLGKGLFDSASLDLRFAVNKTLDPRITFTRASTGTYVGGDGALKTAVTNLLLRSEEFDNASVIKVNAAVTANAIAAPNGTLTADKFVENTAASAAHIVANETFSVTSGLSYRLSVYCKAAERNWVFMLGSGVPFGVNGIYVNLSNGATGSSTGSPSSVIVTPFDNGWYRISFSLTAGSSAAAGLQVRTAIGDGGGTYTGDGTSGIYVWGAQLEQASTAGEYIPTTSTINSAPRFDHNPTTGESLGLLVEEARTNSITNNTMVGAVAGTPGTLPTGWPFQSGGGLGLSVSIVGTGTESGVAYLDWRISGTASANTSATICFGRGSALTAQTWTVSSYLKLAAGSLSGVTSMTLDLIEETAANVFITGSQYSITLPTTASLITQRPTASRTLTGGATVALIRTNLSVNVSSGSTVDFTIRIGLPQLEQGAFATSVIPTISTTVTRAADVASVTGTNFSSWYNQTEGTFFCSTFAPKGAIVYGTGDTFDNTQYVTATASNNVTIRSGGAGSATLTAPISTTTVTNIAHGYAANNFAAVSNGGTIATDTSGAVPLAQVRLKLGSSAWDTSGDNNINGHIKRLTFWPIRLPNTTLQAITTP